MGRPPPRTLARQAGAALLLLMFLVALTGILLAVVGEVTHTMTRREREAQLLFAGDEFRRALASYYDASPADARRYPERLDQLVLDTRQQVPARHLRRLYRDPMTGKADWVLLRKGGGIVGLHSRDGGIPLKQDNFPDWALGFRGAKSYAAWQFSAAGSGQRPDPPALAADRDKAAADAAGKTPPPRT